MIQFYDYSLDTYLNATVELINNGSVALSTLQSHVSRILGVKYDLGLFENRYIPGTVNSQALTDAHVPLTLEAAQKSIALLENRNSILPIRPKAHNISKIALIGPFGDALNYVSRSKSSTQRRINAFKGDYSGQYGAYPTSKSSTIRQSMLSYLSTNSPNISLVSSWGDRKSVV